MGALEQESKRLALLLEPEPRQALGLPEIINLVSEVLATVIKACPEHSAGELKSSARGALDAPRLHRRALLTVRNRADEAVEAAYGRKREIGRRMFKRLAQELTQRTLEEAARADEGRIEAVRLAVLVSGEVPDGGR